MKVSEVVGKIVSTIDMDTRRMSMSDYRSVLEELIDHLENRLECSPDENEDDEK